MVFLVVYPYTFGVTDWLTEWVSESHPACHGYLFLLRYTRVNFRLCFPSDATTGVSMVNRLKGLRESLVSEWRHIENLKFRSAGNQLCRRNCNWIYINANQDLYLRTESLWWYFAWSCTSVIGLHSHFELNWYCVEGSFYLISRQGPEF
jgi:hypothetical protein